MPAWVSTGYAEYTKRLPNSIQLELIEIPLNKRHKNADISRLLGIESKQMLSTIASHDYVIALHRVGKAWSTEELAIQLERWLASGQTISLLIGGPEGLSQDCLNRANECWSLSNLTFPHPLVRVLVAEQLYRASSILAHHPYHR